MKFRPIKFPRDESKHKCDVEWWYFNGHLQDAKGGRYAFMDCLFKVNPQRIKANFLKSALVKGLVHKDEVYFAHHLVSDLKKRTKNSSIKYLCLPTKINFPNKKFAINYIAPLSQPLGFVSEMTKIDATHYHIKNENLDLYFETKKLPLLVGGRGFINLGDEETYYYSLTSLETRGTIYLNNKQIKVTGKSWMDHQWSDPRHSKFLWTWFSMQLENGTEIICSNCVDGKNITFFASLVLKHGKTIHTDKFQLIDMNNHWTSPLTQAVYPLSWKIRIPKFKAEFLVTPAIKNEEMLYGFINYWEGPTIVKGRVKGKKVTGNGFLELEGYPIKISAMKLIKREIKSAIFG